MITSPEVIPVVGAVRDQDVIRRADGVLAPVPTGERRWSTPEMLAVEERLVASALGRREDGVAENFHTGQNRELLQKLSEQTGGRYFKPEEASKLSNEISYSEAGITARETRDLWDMPIVFLLALGIRASEWLLRRKWGVV